MVVRATRAPISGGIEPVKCAHSGAEVRVVLQSVSCCLHRGIIYESSLEIRLFFTTHFEGNAGEINDEATCLDSKHRTSLLQVHWWNNAVLSSLSSTGPTSGSPHCSTCLPCTPQPIPLPPPMTPLRDQPSPTVRLASTDDVFLTNARVR